MATPLYEEFMLRISRPATCLAENFSPGREAWAGIFSAVAGMTALSVDLRAILCNYKTQPYAGKDKSKNNRRTEIRAGQDVASAFRTTGGNQLWQDGRDAIKTASVNRARRKTPRSSAAAS